MLFFGLFNKLGNGVLVEIFDVVSIKIFITFTSFSFQLSTKIRVGQGHWQERSLLVVACCVLCRVSCSV